MTKILVADDHPLFREAIIGVLNAHFNPLNIVQSDSLDSTLKALEEHTDIDLILLDLQMPGCEYSYGVLRVSKDYPAIPIAVISANESIQVISQVIGIGAKGFIPKVTPTKQLVEAISMILAGNCWLPRGLSEQLQKFSKEQQKIVSKVAEITPKQFEVLKLLQQGMLNKQIAGDLNITEATVKAHISAVFRKLGVNTRTQAVLAMEKLQLD